MINLSSSIIQTLLGFLFLHEGESFYGNELVNRLKLDKRNLYKKLKELVQVGLLKTEQKGNLTLYRLNPDFPLYNEYKMIILKTVGIERQLQALIKRVNGVQRAFIFGSYARNHMDAASDIDLMVIGDHQALELQKKISGLQKKYDRDINVISLSNDEFKRRKNDPFLKNAIKEQKIELV